MWVKSFIKLIPKCKTSNYHLIILFCRNIQTFTCSEEQDITINKIYASLIQDRQRNQLIFEDISAALKDKRACVVLTERSEHIDCFADYFKNITQNLVILTGGSWK